jgi:hypothetical protein
MAKELELSKTVCVRLRPETVEALQSLADADQRPLSQFVRLQLEKLATKGSRK